MSIDAAEFLIAAALVGALLAAAEAGRLFARRAAAASSGETESSASHLGALQGALLGLLGLIPGFSFSGASSRFIDRQDFIVREANAIGTAGLRADLLSEPQRGEFRAALQEYLARRIALQTAYMADRVPIVQDMERLQGRMWAAAIQGVEAKPSMAMVVLPPINEIIDLHGSRTAAMRRHLPLAVVALLIVMAMVTLGAVGFGVAVRSGGHRALTRCLALLVAATLWVTIDLDHPRFGLIRLDSTALTSLKLMGATGSHASADEVVPARRDPAMGNR